jgi:phospholipid/cholesterol/gamma-HCH transport system permease protein
MQKNKNIIVIPEQFTLNNSATLFDQLEKIDRNDSIKLDFKNMKHFDSSGIAFLNFLGKNYTNVSFENLKQDLSKIMSSFSTRTEVVEKTMHKFSVRDKLESLSNKFYQFKSELARFLSLLSDEVFYSLQFLFKRKGIYPGEIINQLFFMGYNSYPIVCVISFLVGVTISLTSAEQLRNFGADIYLADLVGFGMIRELVPLMTGIILSGKIGASITAEISSMKVLEEIDALKTMGLIPEKFLMVPRLIAITLAIPLLVAMADIIGIFGGVLVAVFFSGIPPVAFFNEMFTIVKLPDFFIGIGKTMIFGWVVVISSGYKGFFVERSAVGVGKATTESVVLSISIIIVFDCIFALILY